MNKKFLKDSLAWGVGLWLIGYVLGIIAFGLVPANMIGWVVSPIGILITLWVLVKKVNGKDMLYYLKVAIAWTIIAIVFDYLFLVLLFNPADGYYKLDVYFYYFTTFVLPLIIGIIATSPKPHLGESGLSVYRNKLPKFMQRSSATILLSRQEKEKSEHLQRVMELAGSQEQIKNDDVQKLLKVSDATAERYLNELEKEGKLKQVGSTGRGVFYKKA